ncbi:MAG: RDD family protein, partial [Candidatus Acidiferrales bacterium]
LCAVSIVMMWIYYAWMESSSHQGTLGKMALGLIVTDLEGRRISFARASGRYFAKIITSLIPLGIGYMMAGFTEKKQALHDIIASCLVLRKV